MLIQDLAIGDSARIVAYAAGSHRYRQRLLELGLTPQTVVTLVRIAPFGDPIALTVRGTVIMLRAQEAAILHLEALDPMHNTTPITPAALGGNG
jgi:Fe2+ transport system protein FeoA